MTAHIDIEIVNDATWLAACGGNEREAFTLTAARRAVLTELVEGGPAESTSGKATEVLYKRLRKRRYDGQQTALNGVLHAPTMELAIDRDINGKRTLRIELVRLPERWAHLLPAPPVEEPTPEPETLIGKIDQWLSDSPVEEPTPEPVEYGTLEVPGVDWSRYGLIDPSSDDDGLPSLRVVVAEHVATALLSKCLAIMAAARDDATAVADRDDARRRLSAAVEESERWRRRAGEAERELTALKSTLEGMRTRLRAAEVNMEKLASGNGDINRLVNELVHVELDKVMRSKPSPR